MPLKRTQENPAGTRHAPDSNPAEAANNANNTLGSPDRRGSLIGALGAAAVIPAIAQAPQQPGSPNATPRDWSGSQPVQYPDPDIVALDNRFCRYWSATPPSSGFTRERPGPRVRRGMAWAATSSGATSPTTSRCAGSNAGSETMAASPHSAVPPATATATLSISKAASFPANTAGRRVDRYEYDGTVTVIAEGIVISQRRARIRRIPGGNGLKPASACH